ncbi:MAG: BACON domain-containing protein [Bacteroidales bacterium]|nr:BACON domain-containing protein [Bacteroidales bacterium]
MKAIKYISVPVIAAALLCLFASCEKNESTMSKAVMVSASSLSFDVNGGTQTITVYADADWVADVPEWITVSPSSGNCVVDVDITVGDNYLGGEPDAPRNGTVVFHGSTIASEAPLVVKQDGNKYRYVQDWTVDQIASLDDDTVVSLPNVLVVALSTSGFMVSDANNTANVFISSSEEVEIGDVVTVMGDKESSYGLPVIVLDTYETISTGATVTYPEPLDITSQVDTYTSTEWKYVSVSGRLNGTILTIDDATYGVNIVDTPESVGIGSLTGHKLTLTGYYAGTAAPYVRVLGTSVEDLGLVITYFFNEDFEWLDDWSVAGSAGRTVEDNNLDATAPQIGTPKVDGVSACDALLAAGYTFIRYNGESETTSECIYLQQNYLKFGKTGYHAGMTLPQITGVPEKLNTLKMTFDWCPMRQGSGKVDPVTLVIKFETGNAEIDFETTHNWENDHVLEWIPVEFDLAAAGVTITDETTITIMQTDEQMVATTANRWFIDNIQIYSED